MAVPFRPSSRAAGVRALHLCPTCGSRLVQAQMWSHPEQEHSLIELYCPECFWTHVGEFKRSEVEAFLAGRDRAAAELHVLAEQLDRERFQEQAAAFIGALRAGGIEPMDF